MSDDTAQFPPCLRAATYQPGEPKRGCRLHAGWRFVTPETCQSCPMAGITDPTEAATAEAAIPRKHGKTPAKKPAPIQPAGLPCTHRGPQISTIGCLPCGGAAIPVFDCGLHEQCTVARDAGDGTRFCGKCSDRSPT